ncbi:MAG: DNA-binding Lrp family transcriptional regulator [Paracoccaceae bacterium]|jgi:DNA-binding Lrp family transcriptional regulator
MNLYHCMVDLKDDAKALAFAQSLDNWMEHLKTKGVIQDWRLLRRKLNLASDAHRDFLLEIEVEDLSQLDRAFRLVGSEKDETVERLHRQVHQLVAATDFGLYRPFPDPERAERMGLI